MDTRGEKKKWTSKKNVDGSISSHDGKKFRTRSMEKRGGMAFGFRKTATALTKPVG
jgi:Tfp pilus assembly pilus retraction ATPase PilT